MKNIFNMNSASALVAPEVVANSFKTHNKILPKLNTNESACLI